MLIVVSFFSNTAVNFVIGLLLARFLGPADYGRFALTLAIAVVLQTVAFDWARVATSRFGSANRRDSEPGTQAGIAAMLTLLVGVVSVVGAAVLILPYHLPLSRSLAALAVATAIVNGLYDYRTAQLRALFLDRAYTRLIVGKNALAVALTLGGAAVFGTAEMTLLGVCLSMAGVLLASVPFGRGRALPLRLPDRDLALRIVRYALPIVAANLVYQTIPLADRLIIARQHGFAQSGQFSLAYDIGIRIVAAVGSALDALLFQLAVRADDVHGTVEARQRIGANIAIVFALLLPACVGCWLVLPGFEQLAVPPEFRGSFTTNLRLLLPGLFCFGMITFAIQPLFQIERRTSPLIGVAVLASVANLAFIAVFPSRNDTASYAMAQGAALALALMVLVGWGLAKTRVGPQPRDIAGSTLGAIVMAAAVSGVSSLSSDLMVLPVQVVVGVASYCATLIALDVCDVRSALRSGAPVAVLKRQIVLRSR